MDDSNQLQRIPLEMIRQAMASHGSFKLRALGGSMMPVVRHGEEIIIVPQDPGNVKTGDILFFVTPEGRFLGHRFLGWQTLKDGRRFLLTKGDTLPYVDPPHPPEHLIGRVGAIRRNNRLLRLDYGSACPLMAAVSRLSAVAAAPLLKLTGALPNRVITHYQQLVRYLTCGPVFIMGWLLQRSSTVDNG